MITEEDLIDQIYRWLIEGEVQIVAEGSKGPEDFSAPGTLLFPDGARGFYVVHMEPLHPGLRNRWVGTYELNGVIHGITWQNFYDADGNQIKPSVIRIS